MIGVATFIENKYDTTTAQIEVFRSNWLAIVLGLLVINFLGNIQKYKMISQKKWPSLLFHLAFVLIIIGAGFTRYFGYEGMMPIREGATSNIMYSSEPYLSVEISDPRLPKEHKRSSLGYSKQMLMAETTDNDFYVPFKFEKETIEVSYVSYIKNADYKLYKNIKGGTDVLEVVTSDGEGRQTIHIESGKAERVGSVLVSFNDPSIKGAVAVIQKGDSFNIISPYQINRMVMANEKKDTVQPNTLSPMQFRQLHQVIPQNGIETSIVFANKYENAVKNLENIEGESKRGDALTIKVKIGENVTERVLFGGPKRLASPEYFSFMGYIMRASYGSKEVKLPFSIRLDDFILERYPGSDNPSGYRSEITLYDEGSALTEAHSIFMNNVLDYKGYRFFQSSYDPDEMGTRLSVNHDSAGTNITYLGYLLLGLGFVFSVMNKNGRFFSLVKSLKAIGKKKSTLMCVFIVLGFTTIAHEGHDHSSPKSSFSVGGIGKNNATRISKKHADKFGKVLVQSIDGRFEPINTLALDVIHKIAKKNSIRIEGVGEFTPEQFLLELMVNGKLFESEKIIYVSSDSLRRYLGVTSGKHVSIVDFFSSKSSGESKIKKFAIEASQKDAAKRDRWDKEVIKVGDKIESFLRAQSGEILRIFPSSNPDKNNKWISNYDDEAGNSLSGKINVNGQEITLDNVSYRVIFASYLILLRQGEFDKADEVLDRITAIQRARTPNNFLPSVDKINDEIEYNKSQIFENIKKTYMYLCVLMLILSIIEEVNSQKKGTVFKLFVKWPLLIFVGVFGLTWIYHTYGLTMRWYLTGHAPWSNGYEALIFIAWGVGLVGLIFAKFSRIVPAAAALVGFLIIMTAGHENMDPQLTNLVPVLKSYWLIIHVACITTSYAFFAVGAVLGIVVMIIMLIKNTDNAKYLNLSIAGITHINEMAVIIGVVLAAIGTFLGGVWANESWGRYWGWDAKETWALVIVIVYAMLLHFRFVPGFIRSKFFFNAFGTIFGFGAVCMTFFGVNFYFSKSIHSYAAGDPPAFPIWLWVTIASIFVLTILAGWRDSKINKLVASN